MRAFNRSLILSTAFFHRKASFVQSFNEEELRSANIRYFFPDGCQSPKIEIGATEFSSLFPAKKEPETKTDVRIPPIQKKADKAIEVPPRRKQPKNIEVNVVEVTDAPTTATYEKIQPLEQITVEPTTSKPQIDTIAVQTAIDVTTFKPKVNPITVKPKIDPLPVNPEPITQAPKLTPITIKPEPITPYKHRDSKCSDTCCDDNRPQILMSRASKDSCCKGVSKIVIPIETEVLNRIPTEEIVSVVNESNNVEMLQKLLKLAEKYKF